MNHAHLRARGRMLFECRNIKQIAGSKLSLTYPHFFWGALVFVDGVTELSDHIKHVNRTTQLGIICKLAGVSPDPTVYALAHFCLFFQQKQEGIFFYIWFLHAAIMIKLLPYGSEVCTIFFKIFFLGNLKIWGKTISTLTLFFFFKYHLNESY